MLAYRMPSSRVQSSRMLSFRAQRRTCFIIEQCIGEDRIHEKRVHEKRIPRCARDDKPCKDA